MRIVRSARVSLVIMFASATAWATPLRDTIDMIAQRNAASAAAQERIDKIDEEATALLQRFRDVRSEVESLRAYNAQLSALLASQHEEMSDLHRQMDNATAISRQIMPLMQRMIDTLSSFVELDMPFLPEERAQRISRLREMMQRADVAEAEKFRRVLEAYEIEAEYGRTVESYQGPLKIEGESLTVNFLRFGRVALLFESLDGKMVGQWNAKKHQWETLPPQFRSAIHKGLRIAKKVTAPDLVILPVSAAEESR